ncbi:hypothetical protein UY3_11620 [Chelonia mydas]|uniref:Uncharacterized protein n=1 Tax=Chelonia mydas TaxID=8469 RepID=M7B0A2_CHEMY|nr:hypothetical protein UY3_11620 [Chelonia mydas]
MNLLLLLLGVEMHHQLDSTVTDNGYCAGNCLALGPSGLAKSVTRVWSSTSAKCQTRVSPALEWCSRSRSFVTAMPCQFIYKSNSLRSRLLKILLDETAAARIVSLDDGSVISPGVIAFDEDRIWQHQILYIQ